MFASEKVSPAKMFSLFLDLGSRGSQLGKQQFLKMKNIGTLKKLSGFSPNFSF
jgi:hypothetical protein